MAAGDVDRQVMFGVCFFLGGCEAAPGCTDVPEAVDPQCAEACTGITALCGPSTEGILNPVICGPFCTLYGEQAGGVPDDAGECIAAIRECPPGGEDAKAGAFLGCTTTPPQSCVDACGTLNACAAPVGIPGCLEGCTQLSIGDPAGFQVLEGCIDAAGEDCEAALACIDQ